MREEIERVLDSGEAPAPTEPPKYLTAAGPGDTQSHYEYTITPITAPNVARFGAVVLLRNVTKLKELDRLKTQFVMTASHELRSPLTSIAMSIELLRERAADKLAEPDRELLEVAHEELERLQKLVNELLDLSKIESGRIEMAFAETPIAVMLEAAVAPFRGTAEEKGLHLTVDPKPDVPPVWADANKLAWVVTNLVGNALRYSRSLIQVSAEKAGSWVNIYVRDDGEGIPYEQQARIFDKFVQIQGDRSAGGAGLGLAIAKEIVRAHRGNIWVESEPGQGSLFIIALPVERPPVAGNET
jgi:NtrC-family two-component system sensor histidine kinase KinB